MGVPPPVAAIPNSVSSCFSRLPNQKHAAPRKRGASAPRQVSKIYRALAPAGSPVTITKDPNPTKIP